MNLDPHLTTQVSAEKKQFPKVIGGTSRIAGGGANSVWIIFTARRYASAVYAVIVCLSVCPSACLSVLLSVSVASLYCIETIGRIERDFLAWRLPSTCPTLCCMEIRVSPKIKILPSGTLSETLGLENFATASRWCCQQYSLTVELVDDI